MTRLTRIIFPHITSESFGENNMKTTFQFYFLSMSEPVRDTFMEAWMDMYKWVKTSMDAGTLDRQLLETAIWIKPSEDSPIYFYDARDRAINEGWKRD